MKINKLKYLLVFCPLVLLMACTMRYTPNVYNVKNAPIVTHSHRQPSLAQVGHAIQMAGSGLGWEMHQVRPGYTIGSLNLRGHMAKVGISYNTKAYSITYITSENLMRNGQIHKNYNGWVQNLNKHIQLQLKAL